MAKDYSDLPDELQGGDRPAPMDDATRAEKLAALGVIIAGKRDDAVKARKESGIEEVWKACEDAYLGIDDANRAEFAKAKWAKSTSLNGPLTANTVQQPDNKSTAYVRLTTRYVDMGAAKISEIVLPIDDKAFAFDASPVPDLVAQKNDTTPIRDPSGALVWRQAKPEELAGVIQGNPAAAAQGAQAGATPQVPVTRKDVAEAKMAAATAAAKKAETRVYDWMVESRYPMQMRKVIHDSARIGVGVLKGPFPDERRKRAVTTEDGRKTLHIQKSISPACKWIDPWNLFPERGCGEDIHAGDYILERDYISAAGLKKLKKVRGANTDMHPQGEPIYISTQIDKVLAEGPGKCNETEGRNPNEPEQKNRFELWKFTGTLTREDMQVLNAPGADELPDELAECYAIVTLVNDSPISATFNPLEKTGNFPYRTFPWSRRAGHWAGVGVAEQVAGPQKGVNAGTRALYNNAGKSAGSQIVMDQHKVIPADGSWDLNVGDKLWWLADNADVGDDIGKIFRDFSIPNMGTQLMAIIEYNFRLAEEASNIPLISQGQTGPQDPQTFGQAELQNNNANTLLRDKAYSLDDHITEPLVYDFYEWLLLDTEIPDDEKGDFNINARGSIAMVEKAIQEQVWVQMLPIVSANPKLGQNPKKVMAQWLRGKRINPEMTAYTEEEQAQLDSQPPPKAPQVEAAEIRAAADLHRQEMSDKTRIQAAAMDTDRDTAYNNSLAARDEITARTRAEELKIKRETALLNYQTKLMEFAKDERISLSEAKTRLAETVMELNTQKELAGATQGAPQVATPAIEPPGRAPDGQAFQK